MPGTITPEPEPVEVDTSHILFIGGGAFDGLAKNVEQRRRDATGFKPLYTLEETLRSVRR